MNKFVLSVLIALVASCSMSSAEAQKTLVDGCDTLRQHVSKSMDDMKAQFPPCYEAMITAMYPTGLGNNPKEIGESLVKFFKQTPPEAQLECMGKSIDNIKSMANTFMGMAMAIPSQVDSNCKDAFQGLMGEMKKGIGGNYL